MFHQKYPPESAKRRLYMGKKRGRQDSNPQPLEDVVHEEPKSNALPLRHVLWCGVQGGDKSIQVQKNA